MKNIDKIAFSILLLGGFYLMAKYTFSNEVQKPDHKTTESMRTFISEISEGINEQEALIIETMEKQEQKK